MIGMNAMPPEILVRPDASCVSYRRRRDLAPSTRTTVPLEVVKGAVRNSVPGGPINAESRKEKERAPPPALELLVSGDAQLTRIRDKPHAMSAE